MKILCSLLMLWAIPLAAQMCPGGGADFNSVTSFDPGWIYGCNTGTSCNGGVSFDNRLACQPTLALDACAPAPRCGTGSGDGSNVWFKFFPIDSSATISCFQNTSLVIGIQAFSGGPSCGSLTELGCAVSGGPSGGVQLTLLHLLPGKQYYFRVFGSSARAAQRTGVYCFCGSVGIAGYILPDMLTSFKGYSSGNKVQLEWTTPLLNQVDYFEVERSVNGREFAKAGRVAAKRTGELEQKYFFREAAADDITYYRIREVGLQGATYFSPVIPVRKGNADISTVSIANPNGHRLQVTCQLPAVIGMFDMAGIKVRSFQISAGTHTISTAGLSPGIYFLAGPQWRSVKRFQVTR